MRLTAAAAVLPPTLPDPNHVLADVRRALAEDLGAGDLSAHVVPPDALAIATITAREPAMLCGRPWVEAALRELDPHAELGWRVGEGGWFQAGEVLAELRGAVRALLGVERTALNFLQMLSGVATRTARHVAAIAGTRASIVDTRKTLPGLRHAQKYAVRVGGGLNHRAGLFDAVLLKENHIAAAGGVRRALEAARAMAAQAAFIQVEVETLAQLDEALAAGARMVLLDNMDLPLLRAAVQRNRGRAVLEASGGIGLEGLREIALTGVDRISVGALTKHLQAVDLSLRLRITPAVPMPVASAPAS